MRQGGFAQTWPAGRRGDGLENNGRAGARRAHDHSRQETATRNGLRQRYWLTIFPACRRALNVFETAVVVICPKSAVPHTAGDPPLYPTHNIEYRLKLIEQCSENQHINRHVTLQTSFTSGQHVALQLFTTR